MKRRKKATLKLRGLKTTGLGGMGEAKAASARNPRFLGEKKRNIKKTALGCTFAGKTCYQHLERQGE